MNATDRSSIDKVLAAVRLGWLTVELFARLRRRARARGGGRRAQSDATRRFKFSGRLTQGDRISSGMDQLRKIAARLVPDRKPTFLRSAQDFESLMAETDLETLHDSFDEWSMGVWMALTVEDELVGRAFRFGGSLADTYWDVDGRGPEYLDGMLRSQRLEQIAARFDRIGDHLPPYIPDVLHHTLYKWRIAEELAELDTKQKKRVVERLAAQSEVWRDLLFGSRSAESLLTLKDRRRISWAALAATGALVLIVAILVWLGVLLLAVVGRSFLAAASPWSEQMAQASADLVERLFTWQNLSALVATLSSVVVILTGTVSRASGWTLAFHTRASAWLQSTVIYRRAYRHWGDLDSRRSLDDEQETGQTNRTRQ